MNDLTQKFTTLSSDVRTYIDELELKLAAIEQRQEQTNVSLAAVAAAIQALVPLLEAAAECSCQAAAALSDAPWNAPPDMASLCSDEATSPDDLVFTNCASRSGAAFWVSDGSEHWADWSGTALPAGISVDTSPGVYRLRLAGARWYKVSVDVSPDANSAYMRVYGDSGQELNVLFLGNEPDGRVFYAIGPEAFLDIALSFDNPVPGSGAAPKETAVTICSCG